MKTGRFSTSTGDRRISEPSTLLHYQIKIAKKSHVQEFPGLDTRPIDGIATDHNELHFEVEFWVLCLDGAVGSLGYQKEDPHPVIR